MKKLLLLLLFPFASLAQDEYYADLWFYGGFDEFAVSPSEEIWIVTKPGSVDYAKRFDSLWQNDPTGSIKNLNKSNTFERVTFFSDDTMMISGSIHEYNKGNFIYRSDNRGASWEKVYNGPESWNNAFCSGPDGRAWLSGSSPYVCYTDDSGKTWKLLNKPGFDEKIRFNTICFKQDNKTGLFGTDNGMIFLTPDNCATWTTIPSPLEQGKYKRALKGIGSYIGKIRIAGDFYIVNQDGRIFFTGASEIDWTGLPDIIDFEVAENNSIYLIHKDLTVEFRDSQFNTVWQSKESLDDIPDSFTVRNNNLFALTSRKLYRINSVSFESAPLRTDKYPIDDPDITLTVAKDSVGFSDNFVYKFNRDKSQWYRFMEVPFTIGNAVNHGENVLLADSNLNNCFILDLQTKKMTPHTVPDNLLSGKKIKTLTIERGFLDGGFPPLLDTKVYRRSKSGFKLVSESNSYMDGDNSGSGLDKMPLIIEAATIDNIISEAGLRSKKVTVADLDISDKDIRDFKKLTVEAKKSLEKQSNIRTIPHGYFYDEDNTDFEFYRRMADSIYMVPDTIVDKVLRGPSGWSSNDRDYITMKIEFDDGTYASVTSDDPMPNYMHTPWVVTYDGLSYPIGSVTLGKCVDEITEGELFYEPHNDKVYAIYKIIEYLHKQKLKE